MQTSLPAWWARRAASATGSSGALWAAFGPEGAAFRQRWAERARKDRLLLAPLLAGLVGPERASAEAFTQANIQRILAA